MRNVVVLIGLLTVIFLGARAQAQAQAWVQIEARPTLAEAEDRARAYASAFPDVAGFQLSSGWYAIVLGPYAPEAAAQRLGGLRADNLIPDDSFIATGQVFRQPFWPVGQPGATPPAPDVTPLADPVTPPAPQLAAPAVHPLPTAEPEETLADARRAEAALNREQRQELQSALQAFGFYNSTIDGAFGAGTRAAISAWQTANGHTPTGVMTTRQSAALLALRTQIIAELGLQTVTEAEAGIEIELPMALIAFDHYAPPFVQYSEKNGSSIRALLISQPGDSTTLFGLYDVLQTLEVVPPQGERTRRDRSFTISAANDSVASYTYAELSQGLVKGYMLIWNPSEADKAGRALAAMQTSFKPVGMRALDPGLVTLDDAARHGLLAGMEVRRPALSRSGFYVSGAGDVLTTTDVLQNCTRLTIDRDIEAELTLRDDALGLALLTPRTPLAPRQIAAFAAQPARIGSEIAIAGYSYEDALPSATLTFGAMADTNGLAGEPGLNRLSVAALPGDAGGPVINAAGSVLGMLLPRLQNDGRVLPEEVAFAATGAVIAARLTAGGFAPQMEARGGAMAPEDLTDLATQMTVLVSCWN